MTRMEWLILENARLDRIYEQLLQGIIPVEPIMNTEPMLIEDGLGGLMMLGPEPPAPAPVHQRLKKSRPRTTGPLARKLKSDPKTLFSECSHCRK
jgi:hypothetical protein